MKKILLLFILLTTSSIFAQLQLVSQANGVVTVNYGNDYSLFDPQGSTEVYVYIWVDAAQTNPNLTGTYNDEWNNSADLVVLNYDANVDKFVGQIDFNTHNFEGEGIIPAGTEITNFNLILRNQAGDRQTGNLLATDYGYTNTTLQIEDVSAKNNSYYANGYFYLKGNINGIKEIKVINFSGVEIIHISTFDNIINLSEIKEKYILIYVKQANNTFFIKKIKL